MTQDEQIKRKAVTDMFHMMYWYWTRSMAMYAVAELCTGKITRQELSNSVLQYDREKAQKASDKMQSLYEDKEVLGFVQKYQADMFIQHCPTMQEKLVINKPEESDFKIPVKDVYWVLRKLEQARRQGQMKRLMYWTDTEIGSAELRQAFLEVSKYTETNHRKQSKKYTVSRDEDKETFYVSAKGRLAKLPLYKIKKYMKEKKIVEDHNELRAIDDIPDGQYVKIGSYLQKHFPKVPTKIKEKLQKAFEEIRPCHMVIDRDFKKAYDPIYNNHQDTDGDKASNYSCMSGYGEYAQEFYGGIHGCKVVRWETDRGDQVGRCIMYEYKGERHFVRIYGLYDYHRTMINMLLNEMGENDKFGRGCSIEDLTLETDWDGETHSMYLDGPYGVKRTFEDDKTKYLVVDHNYDFDCKTTEHGTLEYEEDSYYTCERCGERVSEDDAWWVNDMTYCCEECANEDGYYRCHWCDEWEQEDDGIWIDDYFYCCSECAERDGYRRCEHCGEWQYKDDMLEPTSGTYYCDSECAEADGWRGCNHCDDWVHEDDAIKIDDKIYCSEYCAKKAGYVKIGEEWKRAEDVEEVKEQEPEEPKEVVNEG